MSIAPYAFLLLLQAAVAPAQAQTPTQAQTKPQTPTQTPTPTPAPTQTLPPAARLAAPFQVIETTRLAITPVIDGRIDPEEWDPLGTTADGGKTFFEWEPGQLHGAAIVPLGHDAVFSFDLDADGWLHGKDNLEVRLSMASGKPTATIRIVDATNPDGPVWRTFPGIEQAATVAATSDAANTTYEFTFADPGLGILPTDAGDRVGLRVDDPLSTDPPLDAFIPRIMTPVTLAYSRDAGLPAGVKFKVENPGRYYVPGERERIRLLFNGSDAAKLQQLALSTEGPAKNDTSSMTAPFPPFDAKGRAYVDFDTGIRETASIGFRVLKGTLTSADGVSAILETSYRISPPVDVTMVTQPIKVAANDRSIRMAYYLHSNSGHPLAGAVSLTVPMPLKLVNTVEQKFEMATGRARGRQGFEVYVPAKTTGTFVVHFTGEAGGKPIDQVGYITIGTL